MKDIECTLKEVEIAPQDFTTIAKSSTLKDFHHKVRSVMTMISINPEIAPSFNLKGYVAHYKRTKAGYIKTKEK